MIGMLRGKVTIPRLLSALYMKAFLVDVFSVAQKVSDWEYQVKSRIYSGSQLHGNV